MWECLLVFCRAFPSVLAAMDMSKAVLPRLFTLVKSGLYGSAVGTFSFLVPFAELCKFFFIIIYMYIVWISGGEPLVSGDLGRTLQVSETLNPKP